MRANEKKPLPEKKTPRGARKGGGGVALKMCFGGYE